MPVIKQPALRYKAPLFLFIFGILLLAGLLITLSAIALMLLSANKIPQSLFLPIIYIIMCSSAIAGITSALFTPFLESYLSKIFPPIDNRLCFSIAQPGERFRPIVLTPSDVELLPALFDDFNDDFNDGNAEEWSPSGVGNWFVENGEYVVDMGEGRDREGVSVAGDSKWTDCM